jgi:hypothetical protein
VNSVDAMKAADVAPHFDHLTSTRRSHKALFGSSFVFRVKSPQSQMN